MAWEGVGWAVHHIWQFVCQQTCNVTLDLHKTPALLAGALHASGTFNPFLPLPALRCFPSPTPLPHPPPTPPIHTILHTPLPLPPPPSHIHLPDPPPTPLSHTPLHTPLPHPSPTPLCRLTPSKDWLLLRRYDATRRRFCWNRPRKEPEKQPLPPPPPPPHAPSQSPLPKKIKKNQEKNPRKKWHWGCKTSPGTPAVHPHEGARLPMATPPGSSTALLACPTHSPAVCNSACRKHPAALPAYVPAYIVKLLREVRRHA